MTVMAQTEHFMATDVEWDPTGRYVMTGVSWWGHKVTTSSSWKHCWFYNSLMFETDHHDHIIMWLIYTSNIFNNTTFTLNI